MFATDVQVGGRYIIKLAGRFVVVRVDHIDVREKTSYSRGGRYYLCTNERTGRYIVVKSASKFRCHCRKRGEL